MAKLLSKSDFMLFLKHPAWLWVKKNDPMKIPPVDENTQAMFDAGHQFEPYAESLFPGGTPLGFSNYDEYRSLPKRTQEAIDNGNHVLFQPRFEWNNFTCICDIVSFVGNNQVDLYEIKSSTSVRPEHEIDLAFQMAVLEGSGLKVRDIYVIHVNNKYVRKGEIVPNKITTIVSVTGTVKDRHEATLIHMEQALVVAKSSVMPDPNPIFAKLGSKKEWLPIYKNIVGEEESTPETNVELTIYREPIKQFLEELEYPLYFLDYETMMSLVPYFDGHRTYQQIPFQFSLHILESPDAKLAHKEYLHRENSDPSRPLTKQLIKDIGTIGSVIVWNMSFEKNCNITLSKINPEFTEAINNINERIVDLMLPFQKKWYDDSRFNGSASIKQVLPVLCPELSYKELGIQEGGLAQRQWMGAVLDNKHTDQKEIIFSDLIEYCTLDTLAMVEIYNNLSKLE